MAACATEAALVTDSEQMWVVVKAESVEAEAT